MPAHLMAAPMLSTGLAGLVAALATSLIHYEGLSLAYDALPSAALPGRAKVLAVLAMAMAAHACEVLLYALAYRLLGGALDVGGLSGGSVHALADCLYFSAQTYTSLGFGDFTPTGPLRLLAGVEALNGLLMVGWSASSLHLAMERTWVPQRRRRVPT